MSTSLETIISDVTDLRLKGMIRLCMAEVPGFSIQFKNESAWMKLLGFFSRPFNPKFMTDYTTTSNVTVYFPTKQNLLDNQQEYTEVLAHELVHMKERQAQGLVWYTLRYAFPQIFAALSIFAFLAFWSPWFLLFLIFLLCLAPLPSPGRRDIELNGYEMSLAVSYWITSNIDYADVDWYAEQFSGSAYYFMWPWKSDITHELKLRMQKLRTGEVLKRDLFKKVYNVVKAT
jgi:hypothetical protein